MKLLTVSTIAPLSLITSGKSSAKKLHSRRTSMISSRWTQSSNRSAVRVADALEHHGTKGRTITLKVKFADFTCVTRSITIDEPCDNRDIMLMHARILLARTEAGNKKSGSSEYQYQTSILKRRKSSSLSGSLSFLSQCKHIPEPNSYIHASLRVWFILLKSHGKADKGIHGKADGDFIIIVKTQKNPEIGMVESSAGPDTG